MLLPTFIINIILEQDYFNASLSSTILSSIFARALILHLIGKGGVSVWRDIRIAPAHPSKHRPVGGDLRGQNDGLSGNGARHWRGAL